MPETYESIERERNTLRVMVAMLREKLEAIQAHMEDRIRIAEFTPPLSVGKPCPKCGQLLR